MAIVALGISHIDYFQGVLKLGGNRRSLADETWAINKAGGVIHHDLLFRMDDLRKAYEINQKYLNLWNGEVQKVEDAWNEYLMNEHSVPLLTSKAYPEFPTSVEYPLEDVINNLKTSYFNTTPSYALAYAIYLGVEELGLYGIDYSYPGRHDAEAGRACFEFLLKRHLILMLKKQLVQHIHSFHLTGNSKYIQVKYKPVHPCP